VFWTVEDRAYALAYQDYKAMQCQGCGHDLEQSTSRDNQFAYGGEVIRCHACATRTRTVQKFVDDGGDQAGVMFRMTDSPT
jgi:hypothetical protein